MILVADSGSTKTSWCCCYEGGIAWQTQMQGMNPNYASRDQLQDAVEKLKKETETIEQSAPQTIDHIYFYGAGCGRERGKTIIRNLLAQSFPDAEITVETDMLGACRAVLPQGEGTVGILGTGSNLCYCKDGEIVLATPAASFPYGNEGSGADIGRRYIDRCIARGDYYDIHPLFYWSTSEDEWDDMPEPFRRTSLSQFIAQFGSNPNPLQVLASLVPYIDETERREIVPKAIDAFMGKVAKFPYLIDIAPSRPALPAEPGDEFIDPDQWIDEKRASTQRYRDLYLVGGIAYEFSEEVRQSALLHGLTLKAALPSPIQQMAQYHIDKLKNN